jgi:hypothetical protein
MSETNERSVASTGSVADGVSYRSKPIKAARLAALEELSALDQELELEYGLTGNPMIKAQEHTPQTQPTPGEGSVRNGCASGRETVR